MKYLKIVIICGIAILLLFFFFKDVDFKEVIGIVSNINPIYPIVFFVGHFFQYFIRAYRWGIILSPHKKKIPLLTLYNFTAIGFFLNMLPGRLGEPVRGILLAREENIDKSCGLASVVIERMIDFLVMTLVFLVSLFFVKHAESTLLVKLKHLSFYILPFIIVVFFMFYLINSAKVFSRVEKLVTACSVIFPKRFRERAVRFILQFLKGLKLNLPVFDFIKLVISSIMVWLYLTFFYFLLMKGFHIDVDYFESIPYFSILVFFAAIPTPGMTGTIDLGSKVGLIELYKVSPDTAVAFTLLVHVLLLLLWVIPGFIAVWMQGFSFANLKKMKQQVKNEMS